MPATWRVARSLDTLLAELNAAAPRRSKKSDGSIGDAAHATRTSDHNPYIKLGGLGIVRARDFTHDPAGGLDCNKLAAQLVASGDPRIRYLIWNRRIWSPGVGWKPYGGANPHDHHLHLSVSEQPGWFDSTLPWRLPDFKAPAVIIPPVPVLEDDMPTIREIWEHQIATDDGTFSAEELLRRGYQHQNRVVPALVDALLDAPIDRSDVGRGPTSLRSVLQWSDTNTDRVLTGVAEAASAAHAGESADAVAAKVKAAVEGLDLRIAVAGN